MRHDTKAMFPGTVCKKLESEISFASMLQPAASLSQWEITQEMYTANKKAKDTSETASYIIVIIPQVPSYFELIV